MKLALVGGGGVRSPLFVAATLRRAQQIGLEELCLMDIDARKLGLMSELCQEIVRSAGSPFRITTTLDARQAFEGASHVVTTIRVGHEQGRVLDERIALKHGLLGQETTGPGGFAMALRSIPAILDYAELLEKVSPGAWMFNFTNPSGLVAQALHNAGFQHVVGICDGANSGQIAVSKFLELPMRSLRAEIFGLNHLSWTRSVLHDDQDVLAPLLKDERFIQGTYLNMFERGLIDQIGMWIMEYLYYYYYAEQSVAAILSEEETRGEEILRLNRQMLDNLEQINPSLHPQEALGAFIAYENRRHATYMHYARPDAPTLDEADRQMSAVSYHVEDEAGEGYAGVALGIIQALETGEPLYTGLNVPNRGAITGMGDDDVVEVSCRVDQNGIQTLPIGQVPPVQLQLMQTVKLYEQLTVEAVRTRSKQTAIQALMVHPLVLSYSRASALVEEYLQAHATYVGDGWH
jgi:6-phospho-beta-glucosidase